MLVCFEDLACVLFDFDGDDAVYTEYFGQFDRKELREMGLAPYILDPINRKAWKAPGASRNAPRYIELSKQVWDRMRQQGLVDGAF